MKPELLKKLPKLPNNKRKINIHPYSFAGLPEISRMLVKTDINPNNYKLIEQFKGLFYEHQLKDSNIIPILKELISKTLQVDVELLNDTTRKREVVIARQLFCFFARLLTSLPLNSIGLHINRDHATVMHSCKTVKKVIEAPNSDKQLYQDYLSCLKEIQNFEAKMKSN